MESIADIIAAVMKEKKISLRELESKTGISKSAMQRYLKADIKKMPLCDFESVCNYLGLDPATILGWAKRQKNYDAATQEIADSVMGLDQHGKDQMQTFVDFLLATREKPQV